MQGDTIHLDTMPEEETGSTKKRPQILSTIFAWILVVVAAIATYAWHAGYFSPQHHATAANPGYILLNLALANGKMEALYYYDVAHGKYALAQAQGFTPSPSFDGSLIVGAAVSVRKGIGTGGIYLYDVKQATSTLLAPVGHTLPRLPQLSRDNSQVVFNEEPVGVATTSARFFTPSAWSIYIVRAFGTPQKIANGMFPHWSPDDSSILYVADDGLHLYNIASSSDKLVWLMSGGKASARMMLTVSRDGTQLAWTNPLNQQVVVAKITSWSPFGVTVTERIPVFAFWPVFSPDGSKLAFEQVDWSINPTTQPTNARLVIYDFESQSMKTVGDLSKFDQMALFVTGWTQAI